MHDIHSKWSGMSLSMTAAIQMVIQEGVTLSHGYQTHYHQNWVSTSVSMIQWSMACYVHDLMLHPQPSVSMVCCIHHLMCPRPNVFMTQCIHSLLSPHILSQIHCMPTCMHCIGCVCWGKGGGGHTWPRWLGLVCMVGKELKFESWKVKINTQNAFQYHSHCFQKKEKNLYAENQL